MTKITTEDIRKDERITMLVHKANEYLDKLGYTDHGPRHVGYVSRIAGQILEQLGHDPHRVELAKIAGWVHDVGNLVNRHMHALTGATLLFDELQRVGMDFEDVCDLCTAVGSHDMDYGSPVSDISAALIIADKVDAYKKRVRRVFDLKDIHDRVNMSIYETKLTVSKADMQIIFELFMKEHSSPLEFMQIYLKRMTMCEESAAFLGCDFRLIINGLVMNEYGTGQ